MHNTDTSKYDGHTPGPWVADGAVRAQAPAGDGGYDICHLPMIPFHLTDQHSRLANAKLIADAPQILRERDEARELLREALRALRIQRDCGDVQRGELELVEAVRRWLPAEECLYVSPEILYLRLHLKRRDMRNATLAKSTPIGAMN